MTLKEIENSLPFSLKFWPSQNPGVGIKVEFSSQVGFLSYLEEDFMAYYCTRDSYLEAYRQNEFLTSKDDIFAWENGIFFQEQGTSLEELCKILSTKMKSIIIGPHDHELIAKMRTYWGYYSFSKSLGRYSLLSMYDTPFDNSEGKKFNFEIKNFTSDPQKKEGFAAKRDCSINCY